DQQPGALPSRTGHLRRQVYGVDADRRKRQCNDLSFLSDMRLDSLLGEPRLSWTSQRCHWQLRRPEFPRPDYRGVGGVTSPLGLLAVRHAAQACGEAGMITVNSATTDEGCSARPRPARIRGQPIASHLESSASEKAIPRSVGASTLLCVRMSCQAV